MIAGTETHEASVYVPTMTASDLADPTRTWGAASLSAVPLRMVHRSARRTQTEHGIKQDEEYTANVAEGYAIEPGNVLRITAGRFAVGKQLLVTDRRPGPQVDEVVLELKVTNDGPS
jgi:hypothetical protein